MDLLSGQPYWFYKNGALNNYPSISEDLSEEVVIMGGGITGALMAWYLSQAGVPVVVVEKRHIGLGSTSGSTALLQYEIDTHLTKLTELRGEKEAVTAYRLCLEAIYKLQDIAAEVGEEVNFSLRKSVYYASKQDELPELRKEYEARKRHGINVEWWDQDTLRKHFPHIKKSGAILSHDAAQVDTYRLAHCLFQACIKKGARVYDTIQVDEVVHQKEGVLLRLSNGKKIKTRQLIIACGYESQNYLSQTVTRLHSTYAIISKPIPQAGPLWYENALVWESARPYLYMRTTEDQRILIGGKDEAFQSAVKRDKLLKSKSWQLAQAARRLFPDLPFVSDYEWCGTFAETQDGLPYIGGVAEHPNTYFALGFGGNGILFSVIAAEIIRDLILKKKNPHAAIFGFDRA
ncbi:FAD-dependent oxidoreductase [Rhabdobacter roseus]|uniref:Glycine/D-amino acid oxidase-like deaminating enzyme n=1 Tax=Rhabdobacter roseus TaxID=1655419 RepID=A0A840TNA2_9BACT|nr:FAD-dependent oxidoreductase [Rhabdobacter roseus]MBB5285161.1 glycine/D-amino acid oxidase-like deaminating enzyme [Rhabdobacter roseus]